MEVVYGGHLHPPPQVLTFVTDEDLYTLLVNVALSLLQTSMV